MARTARNQKIDSRSARSRLRSRREPYWAKVSAGCHLGYRRMTDGGTWIARFRDRATGRRSYSAIGAADDFRDADGIACFTFDQAQEVARRFFKMEAEKLSGDWSPTHDTITVAEGFALYVADYQSRDGKALGTLKSTINAHILPDLGPVRISQLTRGRLAIWRDKIVNSAPRVRSAAGEAQRFKKGGSPKRKRQSTANRVLTVLKAGLNFLAKDGKVSCRPVWEQIKPFKSVDDARVRYLEDNEARAFLDACGGEFYDLVMSALQTGCRYGELAALRVRDYDHKSGSLFIPQSKSGKSRTVYLTDEGRAHFARLCLGRPQADLILMRASGQPWKKSEAQRPMLDACKASKVETLTFHELRHTYASRLIMRGVSLAVVARQLGHSDTRMVEKHYGHLAPNYIAASVRDNLPPILLPNGEAAE
jgi:integrase